MVDDMICIGEDEDDKEDEDDNEDEDEDEDNDDNLLLWLFIIRFFCLRPI
jgi:hypothetical protein